MSGMNRFDRVSDQNSPFAIQDLVRQVGNIIRHGTIEKIDHTKARARIRIGPLSTAWIPWHEKHAGEDITWSPHSAGEQVVIFCPNGNLAQASFLGGLYQNQGKFPQPETNKDKRLHKLKDGTTIVHDTVAKTRVVTMPDSGAHTIKVKDHNVIVDTSGPRLQNNKGVVSVDPAGKILHANANAKSEITAAGQITHKTLAGAIVRLVGGSTLINCL